MHPRQVLLGSQAGAVTLPACDHYAGVEARMRKALQKQAAFIDRHGVCGFDVTLDCEDGAPVGAEAAHAELVIDVLHGVAPIDGRMPRVGVRVHPVDHPAFAADVRQIVGRAADRIAFVMVPKVERTADVTAAVAAVDAAGGSSLPLQVLIESPLAVHHAFEIAAHPRVESLSFGLMDFVSSHDGAIPADAMGVDGQFRHPLVVRAKVEIASACHAYGKVPSHGVVTEFKDRVALQEAARRASRDLGYTRMWSIHPDQIEPILAAFAPTAEEVDRAADILLAAQAAAWAPISHQGHLHDRASYRYFWRVLERAHQSGLELPLEVRSWWSATAGGDR